MGSSDHHGGGAGAGACNKRSRKASSFADDDDDDKGETSRRRKICEGTPTSGARHDGESGDACGGHAQAAPHGSGSSAGEEDYMCEYDDCDDGDGAGEEDYIYEYDDDGAEGEGAEQAQDDTPAAARAREEQRYVVLTEEDIRSRQEADTAKVAEVLSIPPGFAAVLLRHFKWRVGRVQEEWFTDDRRVRGAVGLPPELVPSARGAGPRVVCGICFDEYPAGRTASAGCEHYYCDGCWRGYVRAAVGDGPRCLSLRCPDPSCSAPVVRELVDEVLSAAGGSADDDGVRYARFWLRSYVEESGGKVRWCGGAGCARALEFLGDAAAADKDVFCECGHGVCWACGEEAHRPVSCGTVRAWLVKNSSDSAETANWVVAHTKACPKCGRPIEKNQGCNHMRCSPPCGHHFCWLCLQPAGGANHYACNDSRPRRSGADADDDMAAAAASTASAEEERLKRRRARASLERYLYHYERWASNRAALESVARDTAALERGELERMARAADVPSTALGFVSEAYRQVADGRRVLRWAHAYGYFLDPERDAAKRALFDDLQNQANRWLECLHAAAELERKDLFGDGKGKEAAVVVAAEAFRAYRQKVANLTGVTRKFLGNLVRAFETDLPEVAAAVNPAK
ncbi:probable E3 ubiquitin-protein ligase ARI7 [Miscanthus floridulus]|uniref:probable E3 ubiquitin-protein ligase ARI7 n=1 Tax=Miscanthus floridulus TaxID=154761 RepID=UPI0034593545